MLSSVKVDVKISAHQGRTRLSSYMVQFKYNMDIQPRAEDRISHVTLYLNQQAVTAWMCIVQKKRYRVSRSQLALAVPIWICLYCTSEVYSIQIILNRGEYLILRIFMSHYHSMYKHKPLIKQIHLVFFN